MWYRKYIIGIVCIVAAAIAIAGIVRPATAGEITLEDVQNQLYYKLSSSDKEEILKELKIASHFKLTKQDLEKLSREDISPEVLEALKALEDQGFTEKGNFLEAVKENITLSYPKEEAIREDLPTSEYFKATEEVLRELKNKSIAPEVFEAVKDLKGKEFTGEKVFLEDIKEKIMLNSQENILKTLNKAEPFKFTKEDLKTLRNEGIPKRVLDALGILGDQEFTKKEFLKAVGANIRLDSSEKETILSETRRFKIIEQDEKELDDEDFWGGFLKKFGSLIGLNFRKKEELFEAVEAEIEKKQSDLFKELDFYEKPILEYASTFTGIRFNGKLEAQAIELLGSPTTVCVKDAPPEMDYRDYIETECDQPLLIQTLFAKNCGNYADTAHLSVTKTKDAIHEFHKDFVWGLNVSGTVEYQGVGVSGSITGGAEWHWTSGESDTFTTSTSWDQSVDATVPPHQRLEMNFIAFKKKVSQDYQQRFIATGDIEPVFKDEVPPEVCVYEDANMSMEKNYQCYDPSDQRKEFGVINFPGALNDNISSFCFTESAIVEIFEHGDANALSWVWYFSKDLVQLPKKEDNFKNLLSKSTMKNDEGVTLDCWCVDLSKNDLPDEVISSMRIINLNKPYVLLSGDYHSKKTPDPVWIEGYGNISVDLLDESYGQWQRAFNVGKYVKLSWLFDNAVDSIEVKRGAKATLYDEGQESELRVFWPGGATSMGDLAGRVSAIKVEAVSGTDIKIQDYLKEPADRTFTITGRYDKVDYAEGHFTRGAARRLSYEECCQHLTATDSVDCEPASWAYDMSSFYVTVKAVFENGNEWLPGGGTITQNGIPCGTECIIAAELMDLPLLWKLEAEPRNQWKFDGWRSETWNVLDGKHKPLPGDTIYAVFVPSGTPTSSEQPDQVKRTIRNSGTGGYLTQEDKLLGQSNEPIQDESKWIFEEIRPGIYEIKNVATEDYIKIGNESMIQVTPQILGWDGSRWILEYADNGKWRIESVLKNDQYMYIKNKIIDEVSGVYGVYGSIEPKWSSTLWEMDPTIPTPAPMSTEDILQLQRRLAELDEKYDPGPLDGLWGRKTETALKTFQQDYGLPATGKLDEKTRDKLGL